MAEKKYNVLLIDRSPEDRLLCKRLLGGRHAGYCFVECEEGGQGVATLEAFPIDCVIVAFDLPDMDGIAVIEKIARLNPPKPIPVIFLTVPGNEDLVVQAIKTGAHGVLVKDELDGNIIKRMVADVIQAAASPSVEPDKKSTAGILHAAGAICHELDVPLRAINGHVESKRRLYAESADQAALMQKILVKTKRLEGLSRKLKTLTRYEIKEFPSLGNKNTSARPRVPVQIH